MTIRIAYRVDHEDSAVVGGVVTYFSDASGADFTLRSALAFARNLSRRASISGAYAIAHCVGGIDVGHIGFIDGRVSDRIGVMKPPTRDKLTTRYYKRAGTGLASIVCRGRVVFTGHSIERRNFEAGWREGEAQRWRETCYGPTGAAALTHGSRAETLAPLPAAGVLS